MMKRNPEHTYDESVGVRLGALCPEGLEGCPVGMLKVLELLL